MYHVVTVDVAGTLTEMGLIGLVYTQETARGRGYGRACVEACVTALRESGIPLVALWSDLEGFYEPMGFRSAGRESLWTLSLAQVEEGMAALSSRPDCELVGPDCEWVGPVVNL